MSGGDVQAVVAQEQAAAFEQGEVVGFEEGHGGFYLVRGGALKFYLDICKLRACRNTK